MPQDTITTLAPRTAAPADLLSHVGPLAELIQAPFAAQVFLPDPRLNEPGIREPLAQFTGRTSVAQVAQRLLDDLAAPRKRTGEPWLLGPDLPQAFAAAQSWAARMLAWETRQRQQPLEDALSTLFTGAFQAAAVSTVGGREQPMTARWVRGLGQRLGAWGEPPQTLDAVGAVLGVTRERVRQVQAKADRGLARLQPLWLPQLDTIADVVREEPRTAQDLSGALVTRGLTRAMFDLRALESVAKWAHHHGVGVGVVDGVVGADPAAVRAASWAASNLTRLPGVGTVASVIELAATKCADPISEGLARKVIDLDPTLRWCDAAHTAFRGATTNPDMVRLRNIARSMLSIAPGPITVDAVIRGYERKSAMRSRQRTVERAAVRPFLADHPDFHVEGDVVTLTTPVDHHDVMGEATAIMADILLAAPERVMDRTLLIEACVAGGMDVNTAGMWTSFHEIIANYGWSVWGLVGASPSPARVTALQESVRSQYERSQFEDGWDSQGRPWFTVRVTKAFMRSGVLSVDWHQHLRGRTFEALTPDGTRTGQVSFSDHNTFVWGWNFALRALSLSAGQTLRATFDTAAGTVTVATN